MKLKISKLFFPINFNLIFLKRNKKNIIILFNENFNFIIYIKNINKIKINKNLNLLEISNDLHKEKFTIKNYFDNFFNKLNNYYFLKIKFKGKGYKLSFFKKIKIINFYFGRSHKTIIKYKNVKIKKYKKYKLILICNNINFLKKISNKITNIRKINFYTGRGLRKSREIIMKRNGKKKTSL